MDHINFLREMRSIPCFDIWLQQQILYMYGIPDDGDAEAGEDGGAGGRGGDGAIVGDFSGFKCFSGPASEKIFEQKV